MTGPGKGPAKERCHRYETQVRYSVDGIGASRGKLGVWKEEG